MPHLYVDGSKFRAPLNYPNLTLTGLGEDLQKQWRGGRSYVDTSRFWAPYLDYQFQNNSLFGVGDALPTQPLPEQLQAYLRTGQPMSTVRRDLGSALGQVPRVLWGAMALGAGFLAYRRWKQHQADMKEWEKHHPPKADGT